MQLNDAEITSFHENGILFFPGLLDPNDIVQLRAELEEILDLDRPEILREKHSNRVRCAFAPHT